MATRSERRLVGSMREKRDSLQQYVDAHEESENPDVLERVDATQEAIEALDAAIEAIEAL